MNELAAAAAVAPMSVDDGAEADASGGSTTSTRATCSTRRPHIYHVGGIDNGQQSAYVSLGEIFLLYTKYSGRSFADVSSNGSRFTPRPVPQTTN